MTILVSDTSVLIDLERGSLLESVFSLSATFAVPDVLFERELKAYGGENLLALGLKVLELDGEGVLLAQSYRARSKQISLPDSFTLALARRDGHTLLTGDGALRSLAEAEGLECHGFLWVIDQLIGAGTVPRVLLAARIELIVSHPRCRLPRREVKLRLEQLLRKEWP
ncbi:hypothetical protein [Geothrix fermentans]|uniref:hypothetical protein n=1 Tax=Geothrix fermentans TaxID=44676 RepID=UPI000414F206|nr:hypothetical protein [Geothrix fermentans]